MTYVLNNADVLPVAVTADAKTRADKPGLLQRFYDALVESRMRSALRELRAHNIRLNETAIVLGDYPYTTLTRDACLPFSR